MNFDLKLFFISAASWIFFGIYFYNIQAESGILFFSLTLIFGSMLIFCIINKEISLTVFFSLSFFASAITPSFFFANQDRYSYAGFSAIKDFKFELLEYYFIAFFLILFLLLTLFFTSIFNYIFIKDRLKNLNSLGKDSKKEKVISSNSNTNNKIRGSSYLLLSFIVFIGLPLIFFMYFNGIGISTIDPEPMPFKIVGVTFYLRNFIFPFLIGYLYYKSNRGFLSYLSIILYGTIIGLLSLSKGLVLLTFFPVLIFALVDQKIFRFIIISLYFILIFSLVSWARQFAFFIDINSDLISLVLANFSLDIIYENFNIISVIDAISGRLYGAQNLVLVSQYQLTNNIYFALNYFIANEASLAEIIYFDMYELPPVVEEGVVIGVGIGYIGSMILLAQNNILLLILFSIITSIYLHICEQISHLFIRMHNSFSPIGVGIGFFLAATLYDGSLYRFYALVVFSILFYVFLKSLILFSFNKINADKSL
jgi:hypothetical protein